MKLVSWLSLVFILMLFIALLQIPIISGEKNSNCESEALYYMLGATWCPHCRALHEFFEKNLRDKYYVCYIDQDERCKDAFIALWNELLAKIGEGRFSVPTTIVIRENRTITAVVVGEVRDIEFWTRLACVNESKDIAYYLGGRQVGLIEVNTTDHSEIISKYLIIPGVERDTRSSMMPSLSEIIPLIVISLIVILPIIGYFVIEYLRK